MATSMLRLFGAEHVHRVVQTGDELRTAGQIFQRGLNGGKTPFRVLIVSAHADADGVNLTNGISVDWKTFFPLFGKDLSHVSVIFSACSVMQDEKIRRYMESDLGSPGHVIGYREPVPWPKSALATLLLINAFAEEDLIDLWNTIATIGHLLGLDIVASLRQGDITGAWPGKRMRFAHAHDYVGLIQEFGMHEMVGDLPSLPELWDLSQVLRSTRDKKKWGKLLEQYVNDRRQHRAVAAPDVQSS